MRRSTRSVAVLVPVAAAGGYLLGRRARAAAGDGEQQGAPVATGSVVSRAREVPRKLRALADLGVEQARHALESLPGSVRIVAAAPPEPGD